MAEIVLQCVECGAADLDLRSSGAILCKNCGRKYPRHSYRNIPVFLSSRSTLKTEEVLAEQGVNASSSLNLAQQHWESTGLGKFLEGARGKVLLNYGCGDGDDRRWLESKGYDVTAFDIYPAQHTDYIADGHELPFADEQFDIVTAVGVFGNLHDPFQGTREVARVLKPGGTLGGSSQVSESQLAHSYFHMSHDGVREILTRAGFHSIEVRMGWSFRECLSRRFWVWNEIKPIRKITAPVNRLSFRIGIGLWKMAYGMRGSSPRSDLALSFAGSLIFRATMG
jgi:SAM-dependent methyltransferase